MKLIEPSSPDREALRRESPKPLHRASVTKPTERDHPSRGFAPLPAGTLVDAWRVVGVLSTDGAMGEIYEVEHTRRRDRAALKVLRPEFSTSDVAMRRFRHEAIAGAGVKHPNLNVVIDAGDYDGRPYFVTDLLEGRNLRDWLMQLGRLPIGDALFVATELSSAIGALHEQAQAIHRDIKPENLFITYRGTVKLLDLGVAKFIENSLARFTTDTGELTGTIAYMAPEQLEREASFSSDLYALGLVLYEMIAGRHPHVEAPGHWPAAATLVPRLLEETPAPLSEVVPACPDSLSRLVAQCLAKSPTDRPASADRLRGLLRAEMRHWQASQPPTSRSLGSIFQRPDRFEIAKRPPRGIPRSAAPIARAERAPRDFAPTQESKVILQPDSPRKNPTKPIAPSEREAPSGTAMPSRRSLRWTVLGMGLFLAACVLAALVTRAIRWPIPRISAPPSNRAEPLREPPIRP